LLEPYASPSAQPYPASGAPHADAGRQLIDFLLMAYSDRLLRYKEVHQQ